MLPAHTMTIEELHKLTHGLDSEGYGHCEVVISVELGLVPASMEFTSFEHEFKIDHTQEEFPHGVVIEEGKGCLVIRDNALMRH